MNDCTTEYQKLPPGWDCRVDQKSGKCYYFNYLTRAMQIEDPRNRYKQLQNEKCSTESISMQPLHGSPYHVYPTSNFPAMKAFQGPNSSLQSVAASPLFSAKGQLQMEMSPILRQSNPQTPRLGNLPRRQTIQETSFSSNIDTDAVVTKINNMFPTASEDHIRLLLKKYLKNIFPKADETLLLDILANSDNNVQKASEKLIAMGYTKRDVAVPPKLSAHGENRQKLSANKTEGEEKIIPLHPKAMTNEEKQQMKVRLQERYKAIAEKVISMALESVNYSEDRASQILQIVQQEDETRARKESTTDDGNKIVEIIVEESQPGTESNRQSTRSSKNSQASEASSKLIKSSQPSSPTSSLSPGRLQKREGFSKHQKKTSLIEKKIKKEIAKMTSAEVDDEGKTKVIVFHVAESSSSEVLNTHSNELTAKVITESSISSCSGSSSSDADEREAIKVKTQRHRDKSDSLKNSPRGSTEEDVDSFPKSEFKSIVGRTPVKGHNSGLAKGPDDRLLLADYVTWNGANPDISTGRKNIAVGADPNLLGERLNIARGHNPELYKGPNGSLAKGSIYCQLNLSRTSNIKCN